MSRPEPAVSARNGERPSSCRPLLYGNAVSLLCQDGRVRKRDVDCSGWKGAKTWVVVPSKSDSEAGAAGSFGSELLRLRDTAWGIFETVAVHAGRFWPQCLE